MSSDGHRLQLDPPIPFDEAMARVAHHVHPLPVEECYLPEAHGRVLAETVTAAHPVPPFDNSTVDGFAVKAEDLRHATSEHPVELEVVGEVSAGDPGDVAFGNGQAVRIMTGAPIPADADAIVMLEWTEWSGTRVRVMRPGTAGQFVRRAGEDIQPGSVVIEAGTRLRPAAIGVLASVGVVNVQVHRTPRLAVLATGDELLALGEELAPGRIRGTNQYVLAGLARECGAQVTDLGVARDDRADLAQRIEQARAYDVLLTSGGVSVGDRDHVQEVLLGAGFEKVFWRVATSPGKPLLFGKLGDTLVFGLPGNPVSSSVAFENFVRPALGKLEGDAGGERIVVRAVTDTALSGPEDRRHFARVSVTWRPDGYHVDEVRPHGSGNLMSMVKANGLAVLPEGVRAVEVGSGVDVILLDGSAVASPQR